MNAMKKTLALSVALTFAGSGAHAALKAGDAAPAFKASAALAGKTIDVHQKHALAKAPVVVYFDPAASTGGRNLQAHEYPENQARFTAAGATIIGVSGDSLERLREFSTDPETCAGKLTVASDADGRIARAFDIATTETPPGRKTTKGQDITHARAERTSLGRARRERLDVERYAAHEVRRGGREEFLHERRRPEARAHAAAERVAGERLEARREFAGRGVAEVAVVLEAPRHIDEPLARDVG